MVQGSDFNAIHFAVCSHEIFKFSWKFVTLSCSFTWIFFLIFLYSLCCLRRQSLYSNHQQIFLNNNQKFKDWIIKCHGLLYQGQWCRRQKTSASLSATKKHQLHTFFKYFSSYPPLHHSSQNAFSICYSFNFSSFGSWIFLSFKEQRLMIMSFPVFGGQPSFFFFVNNKWKFLFNETWSPSGT